VQLAQIDWNDFVVVETIDLFDNEDLPAPNAFARPEKVAGPEIPDAGKHFIIAFNLKGRRPDVSMVTSQLLPSSISSNILPQKPISENTTTADGSKVKKDYVPKTAQKGNFFHDFV
jgi:hypothetical protein